MFLLTRHNENELEEFDRKYEEEYINLNNVWDSKIEDLNSKNDEIMNELYNKHNNELKSKQAELESNQPRNNKIPPQILNIKFQIEKLVKLQKYKEADVMSKKLNTLLEQYATDKNTEITDKCNNIIELIQKSHDKEINAYKVKFENKLSELLTTKNNELSELNKKFITAKNKLLDTQKLNYNKYKKELLSFKANSNIVNN